MSKNSICWRGRDRLVAHVYMPLMKDIDDHKSLDAAGYPVAGPVDHFTLHFNARYPGMDMPHYHVVLWHVTQGAGSAGREMRFAKATILMKLFARRSPHRPRCGELYESFNSERQ
jgi:hypothetical protein